MSATKPQALTGQGNNVSQVVKAYQQNDTHKNVLNLGSKEKESCHATSKTEAA